MAQEHFFKLIESFCSFTGLDRPELIVQGGPIEVNGIVFSLVHKAGINDEFMFIYVDFGQLPVGRELDACLALLQENLFLYNGRGASFAFSPKTSRVILADHREIATTTAEDLTRNLASLASKAKEWRTSYFLDA